MATSGSIDFNMTARQIVEYALKKINVVPRFDDVDADNMTHAIAELNVMLKGWQLQGPNLWRQTEGSVTITSATQSYTLSPRPYRLTHARFKDGTREIPMIPLTRQDYFELPVKSAVGTPTQYYFDPQRAAGTLYVWPVITTAASETIEYTYQRLFEDVDDASNDLDIPPEYFDVIGYNLAARLADDAGRSDAVANRVIQRADILMQMAMDEDREDVFLMQPDPQYA